MAWSGGSTVEPDDLFELGRELRIVGQLEPARQIRPQAVSAPDPLHRTDAYTNGLRHRRARPMAGGRRRPPRSGPQRVRPPLGSAVEWARDASCRAKVPPRLPRRTVPASAKSPSWPCRWPAGFRQCHDIGRQKNNLRSPNVLLWAVAVGPHRLKLAAVGGTQSNVRSLVHSSNSHMRVRRESLSESNCQI